MNTNAGFQLHYCILRPRWRVLTHRSILVCGGVHLVKLLTAGGLCNGFSPVATRIFTMRQEFYSALCWWSQFGSPSKNSVNGRDWGRYRGRRLVIGWSGAKEFSIWSLGAAEFRGAAGFLDAPVAEALAEFEGHSHGVGGNSGRGAQDGAFERASARVDGHRNRGSRFPRPLPPPACCEGCCSRSVRWTRSRSPWLR